MSERLESIESHPRADDDGRRRCAFSRVSREQTNAPLSPLRARTSLPRASVRRRRRRQSNPIQSSSAREARPNRSGHVTSPMPCQSPRSFSQVSVSVEGGVARVYINQGVMTRQTVPPSDRHRPRLVPVGRSTHSCRVHVRARRVVFIHSSTAIPRRRTEGDAREVVDWTRGRTRGRADGR